MQIARLNPERSIPHAVLSGASGLAILTVVKAGALLTYKLGTGLVVARRSDGSWSPPSAIVSVGLGWGAQVLTTLLISSLSLIWTICCPSIYEMRFFFVLLHLIQFA